MGSTVIDTGPVNVRGVITARFARVVYADGTLHIVTQDGKGFRYQSTPLTEPTEPSHNGGWWRGETPDGGTVSFTRRGCSTCGGRYRPLQRLDREAIIGGTV